MTRKTAVQRDRAANRSGPGTRNRGKVLLEIFRRLFAAYGPQHWWPADEPFEVMVGAVLTQSTAWTNVAKAISNLQAADAMSPRAIRRLGLERLAGLIRPSGYYNVKSRKLMALVSWLGEHDDNLERLFGESRRQLRLELLDVYGIGEETADSILLYAAGKPVFVVDAYTRHIVDRIGLETAGDSYVDYQALFESSLPADFAKFNEYHALLVEHGKRFCRKVPVCPECPLLDICRHGRRTIKQDRQPSE